MKYLFVLFASVLLLCQCATQPKTITSFVEAAPVYKYTNAGNWDVFEVTTYGTNSIDELGANAKAKLIKMLIETGYRGLKDFKPLVTNPMQQERLLNEDYQKVLSVIDDPSCMEVDYKKMIKPIFLSKRKVYTKTFMVTINVNNIKNKLK